jgi:hypothetical protein
MGPTVGRARFSRSIAMTSFRHMVAPGDRLRIGTTLMLVAGTAACGSAGPRIAPTPRASAPSPCLVLPPPASPPESVLVAVSLTSVPLARLLEAQTAETPIRVDCQGRQYSMTPALPAGVGAYRIIAAPAGGLIRLTPTSGQGTRIGIRSIPRSASRDAIDGGDDLVITDDPAAIDYASRRQELASIPLPWQRTYVLASPRRAATSVADARSDSGSLLRERLAADAVGATARGADLAGWWLDGVSCAPRTPAPPAPPRGSRIAFDSGDPTARAVAERLVALANRPESPLAPIAPELVAARGRVTTAALGQAELSAALAQGTELAYVLSVPRDPVSPCSAYADLIGRAGWLAGPAGVLPLVDFRPYAIARRDRIALFADAEGTYRLGNAVASGAPRP